MSTPLTINVGGFMFLPLEKALLPARILATSFVSFAMLPNSSAAGEWVVLWCFILFLWLGFGFRL